MTFADTFGAATPWIACLVGGVVGIVFSLLHAVATINLRADHIISGTVINLMAPALGVFLVKLFIKRTNRYDYTIIWLFFFPRIVKIPVIGELFFAKTSLPAFVAILIAILAWFVIYKTRFGLRLRSVGNIHKRQIHWELMST